MTVTTSTVTSLYDLAVDLLDAVVTAMGTTDAGVPQFNYISLGDPAFGAEACGQAIVQILALSEGQTSPTTPAEITGNRARYARVNEATLVAYAMRCLDVTRGNQQVYQPLAIEDLSGQAKQTYEDAWAIWNYVNRAVRNGTLFGGPCSIVHMSGGTPITPEAGIGGWKFSCRVEIAGYDPTASS